MSANIDTLIRPPAPAPTIQTWAETTFPPLLQHKPHAVVIHFQELGGKAEDPIDDTLAAIATSIASTCGPEWSASPLVRDYGTGSEFSALGMLVIVHTSCLPHLSVWDFDSAHWTPYTSSSWGMTPPGDGSPVLDAQSVQSVLVSPVLGAHGLRKGFMVLGLEFASLASALFVNVHLPHDADNRIALLGQASPSPYALLRAAGMGYILAMLQRMTFASLAPPAVVVAGDTNARLDGPSAMDYLGLDPTSVGEKSVSLGEAEIEAFTDPDVREGTFAALDFELASSGLVDVAPVTFAATYPQIAREIGPKTTLPEYSGKRMPAWPDRILTLGGKGYDVHSYSAVDAGCDHAAVVAEGRLDPLTLTTRDNVPFHIGIIHPDSFLYPGEEQVRFKVLLEPVGVDSWTQYDEGSIHIVAFQKVDGNASDDPSVGVVPDPDSPGMSYHVVGVVMYHLEEQRLMQMAVSDSFQGQGVGSALVRSLERVLLRYGAGDEKVYVTLHARDSAVPFYARLGYSVHSEPFEEVGVPHSHMHKTLSASEASSAASEASC